jgi:hypothetical protein
VTNRLGNVHSDAVVVQSEILSSPLSGGATETMNSFIQASRCPGREENQAHFEHKPDAFLLQPTKFIRGEPYFFHKLKGP